MSDATHRSIDDLCNQALSDQTNWGRTLGVNTRGMTRAMRRDLLELSEDRDAAHDRLVVQQRESDAIVARGGHLPPSPKPYRHDAESFAGVTLASLAAEQPAAAETGLVRLSDLRATAEDETALAAEAARIAGAAQIADERDASDTAGLPEMGRNGTKWDVGANVELPDRPLGPSDPMVSPETHVPCVAPAVPEKPAGSPGVESLTHRQRAAIAKLVCGRPLVAVAAELNVGRSTLHRWRQEPAFKNELARLSSDALDAAAAHCRVTMLKAALALAEPLIGEGRHQWALKLVGSRRLWDIGNARLPQEAEEETAEVAER